MQTQTRRVSPFKLLMFLAIAALLLVVVRFYREEDSPQESPTEYEKTQQSESPAPTDNKSTDDAKAEMPNETAKKLVSAWNRGNGQEVAELFTSDGTLTMPNGANIQSKAEIAKLITEKRAGPLSETTLTNTVDEVFPQDDKTAIVKGRYQLDGIKVVGFRTAATGTFVLRQVQRDGKWLISKAELTTGGDG